jgi:hypothetical protein
MSNIAKAIERDILRERSEPAAPAIHLSPKLLKALQDLAASEDQTLEALTTTLIKEALTYRRFSEEDARIGLGRIVRFFNDLGN